MPMLKDGLRSLTSNEKESGPIAWKGRIKRSIKVYRRCKQDKSKSEEELKDMCIAINKSIRDYNAKYGEFK